MGHEIQREAIHTWAQKNELERSLLAGFHGVPELKKDEKIYFLGEFKERVIKLLTKRQVAEPIIYPEIVKALQAKNAAKMIISGAIDNRLSDKYRKLASKMKKPCTVIHDQQFKGDVGLIIASEKAVDNTTIDVEFRKARLKRLGLSEKLIGAVGKKICRKCYQKLLQLAPQEAANYSTLSWTDRLLGEHCPAHKKKLQ